MTNSQIQRERELLAECLRDLTEYPASRFAGRGLIICAGGPLLFTNAYVLVHVLRHQMNCRLPIEIWYLGSPEMSSRMLFLLEELGVSAIDARTELPPYLSISHGWQLKSYALMHSRFEEVLLLDADQVPLRDPEEIFDWPLYTSRGAVLWPDIVDVDAKNPIWHVCGLVGQAVTAVESGQLALNKRHHWTALQVIVHLNRRAEFFYEILYGDKDCFLFGFLLTNSEFGRIETRPFSDRGLCLFQRDPTGEVIFQHRTGAKWRYAGPQTPVEGFSGEDFCRAALAELRTKWNGLVFHPPERTGAAMRHEEELARRGAVEFVRPGHAAVTLALCTGFEIGQGRSEDRVNWYCLEQGGSVDLVLCDPFGPTWRLRKHHPSAWYGSSTVEEELKAFAKPVSPTPQKLSESATWGDWPRPGLYSRPEDELP
jgi:hypothetical protein